MPDSEREGLIQALTAAGHPPVELRDPGGGSALLLRYGARVLGLFVQDDAGSTLRVDPVLTEPASAREALEGDEWVILGGDRTWVSPEREIFIGDLSDAWGTYHFPLSVDPGQYTLERRGERGGDAVAMTNRTQVSLLRRGISCEVEIDKVVRMVPNPLRHEAWARDWLSEVAYAGYEQETGLRLVSTPDPSVQVGLWNILVLPAGGQIIIPTVGPVEVRDYFDPTGPEHLEVGAGAVRFNLDAREQHKIGVRAASVTGRGAYVRRVGDDRWSLLVRNFLVNPSGEYVDVPWDDPDDLGYAVQVYNDDGTSGAFGELEYHVPAVGGDTGRDACVDFSQVWAFEGSREHIRAIADALLGQDLPSGGV